MRTNSFTAFIHMLIQRNKHCLISALCQEQLVTELMIGICTETNTRSWKLKDLGGISVTLFFDSLFIYP